MVWHAIFLSLPWLCCCLASQEVRNVPRSYRRECPVDPEIITLNRDDLERGHRQLTSNQALIDKNIRGSVSSLKEESTSLGTVSGLSPTSFENDIHFNYDRNLRAETVDVRSCSCYDLGPVYCPLSVDHCAIIRRYNSTIHGPSPLVCIEPTEAIDEFAETAFLIAFLWFSVLLSCIVCTPWGRNFLHCGLSHCIPRYNRILAWHILQTDRDRARDMIHRQVNSRRQIMIQRLEQVSPELAAELLNGQIMLNRTMHPLQNGSEKPSSLALKTRIFQPENPTQKESSEHDSQVQDDPDDNCLEESCIICFQPIEAGDRIGDLSCNHVFHADCLKTWLKRRNSCPLCNATEVATPRTVIDSNQSSEVTGSVTESRRSTIQQVSDDSSLSLTE